MEKDVEPVWDGLVNAKFRLGALRRMAEDMARSLGDMAEMAEELAGRVEKKP